MDIVFLTNFPDVINLKDGYFQRVLSINLQLEEINRQYIRYSKAYFSFLPQKNVINNEGVEFLINPLNPLHLLFVIVKVLSSDAIYFHSIYRLHSFFHRLLFLIAKKSIIDLHGAVPEELEMQGKIKEYRVFEKVEKFAIKNADIIICVTEKLLYHIKNKYQIDYSQKNFLLIPILPIKICVQNNEKDITSNTVIYSGGLQKWQQVEKMLEYVHKNEKRMEFIFLVSDPEKIQSMYFEKYEEKFPGFIKSVLPDEIAQYYRKSTFGLILRENNVVNSVACPTKLTEYIQNDIIPTVDLEDIGDFKKMRYRYIKEKDDLPNVTIRQEIILENRKVFKKMSLCFDEGMKQLRNLINE